MDPDIIVIGAGAAGLAATGELARQGLCVRLIEARGRLGGRVFSVQPAGWSQPAELGAEFVHGGNRVIRSVLKNVGVRTYPLAPNMWYCANGRLEPAPDYWEKIGRVAGRIPKRDHHWSFRQFLRHRGGKIPADERALAESYVGSFNAAATDQISAHALRDHRAGADTVDSKIAGRYDSIVRGLRKRWPVRRVDLRLETVAKKIRWRAGEVSVQTRTRQGRVEVHRARAVVIALPLGVLKARRVSFFPPLKAKQSLIDQGGWGNVVRIVIRFRAGFWSAPFMPESLGMGQGRKFGFVSAPAESMPVWWALAAPAPVLTGWAGGETADRIKPSAPRTVLQEAVKSLANIFRTSRRELHGWIADWLTHDWRRDPFALGAYSFPRAGHEDVGERLAEPVQGTLFFAGEALAADFGTVHGAMESGRDAAHRVIAALQSARRGAGTSSSM